MKALIITVITFLSINALTWFTGVDKVKSFKQHEWVAKIPHFRAIQNKLTKAKKNILIIGSSQSYYGINEEVMVSQLGQNVFVYNLSVIGGSLIHSGLLLENYVNERSWDEIYIEISPRMFNNINEKNTYAIKHLSNISNALIFFRHGSFAQIKDYLASLFSIFDYFHFGHRASEPSNLPHYRYSDFLEKIYQDETSTFKFEHLAGYFWKVFQDKNKIHFFEIPTFIQRDQIYSPAANNFYEHTILAKTKIKTLPSPTLKEELFYSDQVHLNQFGAIKFSQQLANGLWANGRPEEMNFSQEICSDDGYFKQKVQEVIFKRDRTRLKSDTLYLGDSHFYFLHNNIADNFGIPAQTTDSLNKILNLSYIEGHQQLKRIKLHIGINDLVNCSKTPDQYKKDFLTLLNTIHKNFPGVHVEVLPLLPVTEKLPSFLDHLRQKSEAQINQEVASINAWLREKKYLDRAYPSELLVADYLNQDYSSDGIHLNDRGYALFYAFLNPSASTFNAIFPDTWQTFRLIPNNYTKSLTPQETLVSYKKINTSQIEFVFYVEDQSLVNTGCQEDTSIWDGDGVGLFFKDKMSNEYYELEFNACGGVFDAKNSATSTFLEAKKFSIQVQDKKITHSKSGWTISFSIDFGFISPNLENLRFNIHRIDRDRLNSLWSLYSLHPTYVENFHFPEKMKTLMFLKL